jgi:guanylate kinase
MNGKIFLILGPSGVGKGTVIKELKKLFPDFVFPISCTTRVKRAHEKEGEVYYFLTEAEFTRRIEAGDFLEHALVHGGARYGVLKAPVLDALAQGKNLIREVDVQGFVQIRKIIPAKNLITFFLKPPSLDFLRANILKRGVMNEDELSRRLQSAGKELTYADECDYIIEAREDDVVEEVKEIAEKILNLKY